jgi:hypothetical protein
LDKGDHNENHPATGPSDNETAGIDPELLERIKNGWVAAVIAGSILSVLALLAAVDESAFGWLLDGSFYFEAVIIFVLAFGTYKKSRFAATALFVYFLGARIWVIVSTGQPRGIVISLVFLYFFYQAMTATYEYHTAMKRRDQHQD